MHTIQDQKPGLVPGFYFGQGRVQPAPHNLCSARVTPALRGCSKTVMLIPNCFLDTIKKLDRMQRNRSDGFHGF